MTTVFLDLDGVFADFESAVRRHTGCDYDPKSSWSKIDKVPHFYSELYPLSGAFKLFDTIFKGSLYPVQILSSVPDPTGKLVTAREDKEYWVSRYLSRKIRVNLVQGWKMKALFAQPGDILVDDSYRNIEDWVACGGTGIHHTSNWNTLNELRMLGVLK